MFRFVPALPAGALGFAVVLTGCGRQAQVQAKGQPEATPVAVSRVERRELAREVVIAAEFRPYQEIDVHAKVAGYVKKMFVDVGDRVRQGQLLATLEVPELADDLARATAARRRSNAELARARDELARTESAHTAAHLSYARLAGVLKSRPNLVAQQEVDDALARDRVAEAQVSAAKAALTAAQHQVQVSEADEGKVRTLMAYSQITAPFAGVVTRRYADTGAMIQAGTASQTQAMPVVRLSQNQTLRLVIPVPESAVPYIHNGAPIEVRVPTLGRSFVGRVARFSGDVQFSTRTMDTEVDVPNPDLVLMPGMFAEALLTLDRKTDALAVPIEAVPSAAKNPAVLVVTAQNRLEQRAVRLGIETPTHYEVLEGLKPDDLVVLSARGRYRAGQLVAPVLAHPNAAGGAR
jgi:RND family efflux transporter MFP subunit